jgi:hypothetical protein
MWVTKGRACGSEGKKECTKKYYEENNWKNISRKNEERTDNMKMVVWNRGGWKCLRTVFNCSFGPSGFCYQRSQVRHRIQHPTLNYILSYLVHFNIVVKAELLNSLRTDHQSHILYDNRAGAQPFMFRFEDSVSWGPLGP